MYLSQGSVVTSRSVGFGNGRASPLKRGVILAIVAIQSAKSSEKEVRNNFEKTQKMMIEYETRIKEVLAEIDKKSAIIEKNCFRVSKRTYVNHDKYY